MKKLLISIFLISFLFTKPTYAAEYELVPAGSVINSDFIRTGNMVQVDGEIKGDAFLTGGVVTINGKIDGDLFVAAGKINVNGQIGDSIRILAGDVTINGPVGRNVLLLCGNCTVTRTASISGSLLTAGGNLDLSAEKIGKGFRFFGSRLYLNSAIDNEAFVVADREFLLGPEASVSGDLKYSGNTEASLQPGATVAGRIAYQKIQKDESYPRFFGARTILNSYEKIKPATELFGFFVSALIAFMALGLFPKFFEKVTNALESRPAASFGWGIIVSIATPLIIVLLALTIIGLPVALLITLALYILYLAATYLAAFFIGRKILLLKFGERRGWAIILGLFIFYILSLIPVIGSLAKLVVVIFALGAIILSVKQPTIIPERKLPYKTKK